MAVATPADVAVIVGRDLTTAEQATATRRIAAAVNTLEGLLHRTLEVGTFAETYTPDPNGHVPASAQTGWSTLGPGYGVVHLRQRPVAAVTAVTLDGGGDLTASCARPTNDVLVVPTTAKVTVTYTAGDDPVAPEVADTVINAVARGFMVPAVVAAGVEMNYAVEGTSVTYGGRGGPTTGRYGPFRPEEVSALRAALGLLVIR